MRRAILLLVLVTACGSKTPSTAQIREGNDMELGDCTFLGKVEGTASDGDNHAAEHAKNMARENAAKMGATNIKWIVPCCTSVEAEAYRCDTPE